MTKNEKMSQEFILNYYLYVISRPILTKKYVLLDTLISLINDLISGIDCVEYIMAITAQH